MQQDNLITAILFPYFFDQRKQKLKILYRERVNCLKVVSFIHIVSS